MTGSLSYRGFRARVEFDPEDMIFVGHVAGVRDVVGFHAESVPELVTAFHEAVDDYLANCEERGVSPRPEHTTLPPGWTRYEPGQNLENKEDIAEYLAAMAEECAGKPAEKNFGDELIEAMQQAVEVLEGGRLAPSRCWEPPPSDQM